MQINGKKCQKMQKSVKKAMHKELVSPVCGIFIIAWEVKNLGDGKLGVGILVNVARGSFN